MIMTSSLIKAILLSTYNLNDTRIEDVMIA